MKAEVHVVVDERKFIVSFNEDGTPNNIKERKLHAPGEIYEAWYNVSRWQAINSKLNMNNPKSRIVRIIAAAKAKRGE